MTTGKIGLPDAAMSLGVSYAEAYRLLLRGDLQGFRDGKRWVVSTRSLENARRTVHTRGGSDR